MKNSRASQHLDLARGLAAIAVLLYHVRYRLFLDYSDVAHPNVVSRAWYFVTAFGHDAVMVFFVLSGFLIGAPLLTKRDPPEWANYAVNRSVRLYLVLVPGLLLTVFWDQLGLHLFGTNPIYTGSSQPFRNDFFDIRAVGGLSTFVGNLVFVQTILTPPFGSNVALWSLAYEFWYYAAAPLVAVAVLRARTLPQRVRYAVLSVLVLWFIGPDLRRYFVLWALGAILPLLPRPSRLWHPRRWIAGFAALFSGCIIALHVVGANLSVFGCDVVVAIAFTVLLYVLLLDDRPPSSGRLGVMLASCSFTLYVTHLPTLVFLRAMLQVRPWEPTTSHILFALLIAGALFTYAHVIARLSERHTNRVRETVASRLLRRTKVRPSMARLMSASEGTKVPPLPNS